MEELSLKRDKNVVLFGGRATETKDGALTLSAELLLWQKRNEITTELKPEYQAYPTHIHCIYKLES